MVEMVWNFPSAKFFAFDGVEVVVIDPFARQWAPTHKPTLVDPPKPKREPSEDDKAVHRAIGLAPREGKRYGTNDWIKP